MDDFEIELKKDFLIEARDLIENTEKSFLSLEKDPENSTLVDSIFRFAHNLKGTSRAVGFGQIAELTHKAENLLLDIKQGKLKVNAGLVSILLEFNDKVREMIETLSENIEAQFELDDLILKLVQANDPNSSLDSSADKIVEAPKLEIPSASSAQFEDEDDEVLAVAADPIEEPDWEAMKAEMDAPIASPTPVVAKVETKTPVKTEPKKEDETIRVSLTRLEKLTDMVGELVILQSLVESSLVRAGDVKTARSLSKICSNIQELSLSLRMVPVGPTFQKLSRIVRDTSKLLGKKVELKLIGEETEIDKTVAESLSDPLVHIIRNAIDHGIESPEDRVMNNKSEVGNVEVMAFHEGNFLVIQITDDGKGIDGLKLVEKAKKKGIIPGHSNLSNQQGIELIFHAGFSTKEQVSEVSGRGVGMDVVKTNIEALGGEVKVRSLLGEGSCFRLVLPLTLAIIEGILVKTNELTFVLPRNQVHEVIRLEKSKISKHTGQIPSYSLRSEVIPLFHLGKDLMDINNANDEIAVVVRHNGAVFAVVVNDILRKQEIVVKPLTKEMAGKVGIMGTTILSDGKPSLIIDLLDLYSKRVKKENLGAA